MTPCLCVRVFQVTDCCACVGGNTISFAKRFKFVNTVEYSRSRAAALQHNINVCGVGSKCKVFVGDYGYWLPRIKQDVVYMDPPWGGVDYKQHDKLDLTLGPLPLDELVKCVARCACAGCVLLMQWTCLVSQETPAPLQVCDDEAPLQLRRRQVFALRRVSVQGGGAVLAKECAHHAAQGGRAQWCQR